MRGPSEGSLMTKLDAVAAMKLLDGGSAITMAAHVVALLPHGGRRVRLINGHDLDVLPAVRHGRAATLIGDVVSIRLAPGQLHGWRLVEA